MTNETRNNNGYELNKQSCRKLIIIHTHESPNSLKKTMITRIKRKQHKLPKHLQYDSIKLKLNTEKYEIPLKKNN